MTVSPSYINSKTLVQLLLTRHIAAAEPTEATGLVEQRKNMFTLGRKPIDPSLRATIETNDRFLRGVPFGWLRQKMPAYQVLPSRVLLIGDSYQF